MIEKLSTLIWFMQRPSFWSHAFQLIKRKFLIDYDTPQQRVKAERWAIKYVVSNEEALAKLGINGNMRNLSDSIINKGKELANKSAFKMGGPGNLNLLFNAVKLTGAKCIVETGVAYGWSSLAILHAISINGEGKLFSVDMPYPKMGNEDFVGIVVPENLKSSWLLVREPDRCGLDKVISMTGGSIDLCHYDSDKSWWGRAYAFPLLWKALKPGGLFISDDIQDNMFFAEFVKLKSLPFAVTKSHGKFIGLIRKEK